MRGVQNHLQATDLMFIFLKTSTLLHLTVGTMVLMDERERELARQILQVNNSLN